MNVVPASVRALVQPADPGGTRGPGNPALVAQATMMAAQGASAAAMGGLAPLGAAAGAVAGAGAAIAAGNPVDQVKRNIQDIKLELKSLDDLAQRFGVGVFQSMSKAIAGTESFGKAIKGVVGSLGTTLGNDMISAGVAAILHPSRWAPDKPGAGGGEGTPAASGARGAAQAGLGGLADQAGKGLVGLLGKAGIGATPAGMIAGTALAIGGTLLGGLFGGKNKEREEEQFRAHLRALRQAQTEQLMNFTIVLPGGPINPNDPAWKEAVSNTMRSVAGTRTGRVEFQTRR